MKNYTFIFLFIILSITFSACYTAPKDNNDPQISAIGALGRIEAFSGPMYVGNGGQSIRLAVFAPEIQGNLPGYLPLYIQGLLNNNFNRYSNITVIDRQQLNRIINEQKLGINNRLSESDLITIGNLADAQYLIVGTIQRFSRDRVSLQLSIIETSKAARIVTIVKDGVISQIEGSGTLINEAAADLLDQMGVQLTETGKRSLLAGNWTAVQAEAGLARGITAQSADSQVEALFNFSRSVAFNPSQMEALSRLNFITTYISGGTISQSILNDIQARDRWIEAFRETALFFNSHPPFEVTFDPNLMQEGETDYIKRSAHLKMRISLDPSKAGFDALNALLEGLEKTGRRETWGFSGWPLMDINPKVNGTVLFGGKRSFSFKIDAALVNENGRTIGRSSITLNTGTIDFSSGDTKLIPPDGEIGFMDFFNVRAEEITPSLNIVITSVNGIPPGRLNNSGNIKIDAGDLEKKFWILNAFVLVNGGIFTMGSPAIEQGRLDNEGPQRQVMLDSFIIGRYQVTQSEYQEIMGINPSSIKGDYLPVTNVSWYDAIEYCNLLSEREGLNPVYTIDKERIDPNNRNNNDNIRWVVTWDRNADGYRLATEAEWEYACRARTNTAYNIGSNITKVQASYERSNTTVAGSYEPNPWGIYDMHGNVWEWCWDWYDIYQNIAQLNPAGASFGTTRITRGGSWSSTASALRTARRSSNNQFSRFEDVGFRIVRNAPAVQSQFEKDIEAIREAGPGNYTVVLTENVILTNEFNFSGMEWKQIIFQGDSAMRTISRFTDGNIFNIPVNCGIILGQNITLNGNSRPHSIVNINGGMLEMRTGSVITGSSNSGVYIGSGSFNMTGGTIRNNRVGNGSGVYISNGTFTMNGGSITYNTSNGNGGGVYNNGTFTMNGGFITYNTSVENGGGVYNTGILNLNDGNILENTGKYGGGVFNSRTFTMNSGSINNNRSNDDGGGIYNTGTFTMNSGSINSNTSRGAGGGVCIVQGTFTLSSGSINSNTSTGTGGGINITNGTFTMRGGTLNNNTAGTDGGGVFSDNLSAFNKTGGTINANNRARRRGNVWLVRGINRSRTADPSVNAPR